MKKLRLAAIDSIQAGKHFDGPYADMGYFQKYGILKSSTQLGTDTNILDLDRENI